MAGGRAPEVRPLDLGGSPLSVLRRLRGAPGLVALVGAWCGGGAVVACEPAEVHADELAPFALPDRWDAVRADSRGFGAGWIGWWGYQLHRRVEAVPPPPPRPHPQPEVWWGRYDWVLRYDDTTQRWTFESLLDPPAAEAALSGLLARLDRGRDLPQPFGCTPFAMAGGPDHYRAAVAAAREHIWAGDVFQANICTRFDARLDGDPLDLFCAGVEALHPAYAAYLDLGDRQVASLSPELFLRRSGRTVTTRPIKGTAPAAEDHARLDHSAKDRAENVMIVDLMRNDLGRVCETGSVVVPSLAVAEPGAGVRHLVSEVRGTLPPDCSDAALLAATFPPGSVTGAPKVRAMEVVHELETTGREVYTGAIGYLSPVAGLETNVVIRTFEVSGADCWVGVGCGIVADSDPDAELAEVLTKVDPLLGAIGASRSDVVPPPAVERESAGPGPTVEPVSGPHPDPALGVFDTMLVRHGVPVDLTAHLERFTGSVRACYAVAPDPEVLGAQVRAAAAGHTRARLRVTFIPASAEVGVTCEDVAVPPQQPRTLGVRRLAGGLGPHKWTDRRSLRAPDDADDVLLVDEGTRLLEAGTANVFAVLDDEVVTPPLDGRILPGVVRARVLEVLRTSALPCTERPLDLDELARAGEVFTTSSIRGVQPVSAVPQVGAWPVGPLTRWLREHLDAPPSPPAPPRSVQGARVLIVDNYDSFTYNLAQRLRGLGAAVDVVRNDRIGEADLVGGASDATFTHLVISPGPGRPEDAGVSVRAVTAVGRHVPVLGVCLGHQCIAAAYGGQVVRAPRPVHGRRSLVHHDGAGVYADLGAPFVAARYHSLVVADLPPELVPTAHTADGVLMGLRHRSLPTEGVQVHPESILTDLGSTLLGRFLATDLPQNCLS